MKISLLVILFLTSVSILAQKPQKDSLITRPISVDSAQVKGTVFKKDTIKKAFKINPREITKQSAMIPGWGQAKIKNYWFIPVIYAGFGACAYFINFNGGRYKLFRGAYFELSAAEDAYALAIKNNTTAERPADFKELTIKGVTYKFSKSNLKTYMDYYRRYRDLSYVAIPVVWAVNVLEVNVAAHLKSFDMSDDISMKLSPSFPQTALGMGVGAKMTFAFK